jgi:very-short-patch-repair endonuclease
MTEFTRGIWISEKQIDDSVIQQHLRNSFLKLSRIVDKWGFIRQAYMEMMPLIMATAKASPTRGIDPYFLDWEKHFSPIESIAWASIRMRGMPLYPQFPLFNYFIDFANPYFRIGVELDGKQHDQDADRERDDQLAEYGWSIFRISGVEANTEYENLTDAEIADYSEEHKRSVLKHWLLETCDGVIEGLDQIYFKNNESAYYGLALESLDKHWLAGFPLPATA